MSDIKSVDVQPLIDWLSGMAQKGEAFVAEQAPQLAAEIVNYGLVWYWTAIGVCAVLFLLAAIGFIFGIWATNKSKESEAEPFLVIVVLSFAVGFIACGSGLSCTFGLIKVYNAPRLYVVEQVKGLL